MKKIRIVILLTAILGMLGIKTNVYAQTGVSEEYYILNTAPEKITTVAQSISFANQSFQQASGNVIYDYAAFPSTGGDSFKVHCMDRKIQYAQGLEYKKDGIIDNKIVNIIINSYNKYHNNSVYNAVEIEWITQAAIWYYQDSSINPSFGAKELMILGATDIINSAEDCEASVQCYSYRTDVLWEEAKKLANEAKSANTDIADSITFTYDGKYTKDEKNKTIKTSLISVNNLNNLSIAFDLSKMPKGTKLYNESGQEVTSVNSNNKFYFVIPVDNIKNFSIGAEITAKTNDYKYYMGYKYIPANGENYQPLALVTKESKPLTGTLNIKASEVENTLSSISNSIYFIGFIILLSGAGIIYANVKPRKQEI